MNKIIILIFVLFFNIGNVVADDSVYIISGDQVIKQDTWKFVALENITSNILIDDTQIYFYTENYIYGLNSSYGSKNFKVVLKNSLEQKLTDNFLVIKTNYKTYSINKTTGEIIQKEIYPFTLDSIYTLFGLSNSICNCTNGIDGAPGLPGLNGTDGLDGTNGSNGADGINGVNGTDGINGTNGTNSVSGGLTFFLHNNSANISYSAKVMNQSNDFVPLITNLTQNIVNGNTLLMTWVSPPMNLTLIPAGVHELHIHAAKIGNQRTDKLYYECGVTNETGDNITILSTSEITLESIIPDGNITTEFSLDMGMMDINTNLTDRMIVRLYVNQTGTGATPDIRIEYEDFTNARLVFPATPFTSEQIIEIVQPLLNTKVNKSGDTMTGNLNMSDTEIVDVRRISNPIQLNLEGGLSSCTLDGGIGCVYNNTPIWYHDPVTDIFTINKNISLENHTIENCLNCLTSDNGSYIGNGETNRFIPYNLNKISNNIDIVEDSENIQFGKIINHLGYIYSSNRVKIPVTPQNESGFFVSDVFNINNTNITEYIGANTSNATGSSGYIYTFPYTPNVSASIIYIGFDVDVAVGNLRVGLYTSNAGVPQNLLNQSSSVAAAQGKNNLSIVANVTGSTQYFIAYQASSNLLSIRRGGSAFTQYYLGQAYGEFPATLSGLSTQSGVPFYINVQLYNQIRTYYWTAN